MPLVLKTLKTFFLAKTRYHYYRNTYLYTPMPLDTPWRYACDSSGLRAAPPPPGQAANTPLAPTPPRPNSPPPPASFDR